MLLSLGIFSIYGDCIIFNFVYMTSPFKQNCKYLGEETYRECTQEEVCANILNPEFLTQPKVSDKDYIFAMTGASPEVNCWSETSIAFMGQLWFIGFLVKILATPLLEKYGYLCILKAIIIPVNILSFNLQYLPNSYLLRCIGFALAGFSKLKMVPCLILIKDTV
jgi:hypothetical protein